MTNAPRSTSHAKKNAAGPVIKRAAILESTTGSYRWRPDGNR
jgi:hypothetical protein